MARISRWKVHFQSADAVASRKDWSQGHTDGGDADCFTGKATNCSSMPMLCLGAIKQYTCLAFRYIAPDTLATQMGLVYVKIPQDKLSAKPSS